MCIFAGLIAAILLGLDGFFISQGALLIASIALGISLAEKYYATIILKSSQRYLFIFCPFCQPTKHYYSIAYSFNWIRQHH